MPTQRKNHFKGFARPDTGLPLLENFWEFIWIVDGLPSPSSHLLGRSSGVFIPAPVIPEDPPVGIRHPEQLRHGVAQFAKLALAFRQLICDLLALGDVHGGRSE